MNINFSHFPTSDIIFLLIMVEIFSLYCHYWMTLYLSYIRDALRHTHTHRHVHAHALQLLTWNITNECPNFTLEDGRKKNVSSEGINAMGRKKIKLKIRNLILTKLKHFMVRWYSSDNCRCLLPTSTQPDWLSP